MMMMMFLFSLVLSIEGFQATVSACSGVLCRMSDDYRAIVESSIPENHAILIMTLYPSGSTRPMTSFVLVCVCASWTYIRTEESFTSFCDEKR